MTRKLSLLLIVVVVAASTLFVAAQGSARRSGPAHRRPVAGIVHAKAEKVPHVRRYWTKERMRAAEPVDILIASGSPEPVPADEIGSPEALAGKAPQRSAAVKSTVVPNPSDVPYRTHGKVFFSDGGSDYVCSGTVVVSSNESTVLTAGHCVHGGSFVTNFIFVPAYDNGDAPFGEWPATDLYTTDEWASSEDFSYDAAFALIGTQGGATLEDTVGSRGIVFNQDPFQDVEAIGYPAGFPFDGESMRVCETTIDAIDGPAGAPMQIPCDMTGGSSGGGWVMNEQYLHSVVSYGYLELPGFLYGPYFGSTIEELYTEVTGLTPGPGPDPAPTPGPGEQVDHEMLLSLQLVRHLRAKGQMTAPDGYLPCTRSAPIEIYRINRNGVGTYQAATSTNSEGRYSVKLDNRRGKYFAFGPAGYVDDLNFCLEAYSDVVKYRP